MQHTLKILVVTNSLSPSYIYILNVMKFDSIYSSKNKKDIYRSVLWIIFVMVKVKKNSDNATALQDNKIVKLSIN